MTVDRRPGVPRLAMVTDRASDPPRTEASVEAAVRGGVDQVHVRMPGASAREVSAVCERLLPTVRAHGASLIVNDRADVAAAGLADGVHLGQRSLPVQDVRAFLPDLLIGVSAHDPDQISAAARGGADYVFLSPVFRTTSKPGAPALGPQLAAEWTARAGLRVVWLGGITAARLRDLCGDEDFTVPENLVGVAALSPFADPAAAFDNARALADALTAILPDS